MNEKENTTNSELKKPSSYEKINNETCKNDTNTNSQDQQESYNIYKKAAQESQEQKKESAPHSKKDNNSEHKKNPTASKIPNLNIKDGLQTKYKELEEKLKHIQEQHKKQEKDAKIHHLAEIKNMQARYEREVVKAREYSIQSIAKDLLGIGDALEQGIEASDEKQKEGLELIFNIFKKTLHSHSIEEIHPEGKVFDHKWHEAMAIQPDPNTENNHVIKVIQTGYKLKDRLLRPARVLVAKNEKE